MADDVRMLLENQSFRPASEIDGDVPILSGVYAIRLAGQSSLPEPFEAFLAERTSRLIYIGKATTLKKRMLGNELRGRGHGTFFRSIGAVLGFRPLAGSLAERVNKYNFSFQKADRDGIVEWINANLEVSWAEVPAADVPKAELALIVEHTPLLNLDGNPQALVELDELRVLCRGIAAGQQPHCEE
ncbi:GIY-YIG nuclease family protein [Lacisediminihabitans changchengi]|uniref:GIY-YIG catalytic domain-containing protein n=1 Tax=Lacisediminihabitans changchengi TaxID=2787634 RepID=A0A934W392_9MICO|nr:hypothetical protein [Lacisediminihabitans changchengi]MBK4347671.1 hypothetical protein [Lacisediminihabitans changchengi]